MRVRERDPIFPLFVSSPVTRSLRSFLVMTFMAAPVMASAQTFLGAAPSATNHGAARARALNNSGCDRVYVGLLGNLGNGSLRDSYTGNWTGTGTPRDFTFSMQWTGSLLRFEFGELSGLVAGGNNSTSVTSNLVTGGIELAQAGDFNAFRIFGRDVSASLIDLTLNGVDVLTGTGASVANAAAYWTAEPSSSFTVAGRIRTAVCANEGCRFEVGVATVVPEPAAWSAIAAGMVALLVIARRRRA
jgi:hypothetical protein